MNKEYGFVLINDSGLFLRYKRSPTYINFDWVVDITHATFFLDLGQLEKVKVYTGQGKVHRCVRVWEVSNYDPQS